MLVCIFRFDDICDACEEEKVRRTCWHGRREEVAGEEATRRKKLDGSANGARIRCTDMMKIFKGIRGKRDQICETMKRCKDGELLFQGMSVMLLVI